MDLERLKIDRTSAPRSRGRRRGGGWGWLVGLLLLLGLGWLFHRPLLDGVDRLRLPRVATARASRASSLEASAVSGTAANGYVVARRRAALSADTPGRIVEMNVEEGSVVAKDDVVARLYAEEYEAGLARAEAELLTTRASHARAQEEARLARTRVGELAARSASAKAFLTEAEASERLAARDQERAVKLLASGVDTEERVDRSRTELERARARAIASEAALREAQAAQATGEGNVLVAEEFAREAHARIASAAATRDLAAATLSKTFVRAPFDGIVVLKDAEVGEVVSPNSLGGNSRGSVATMVDFDSLEVQVEVPETSLAAVHVGSPTNIYLDAFPERLYRGQVQRIWPTANRQKATVEVRVAFEAPDDALRPEMGARVVFDPEQEDAPETGEASAFGAAETRVFVPANCVVPVDGRPGVFVLERDVVRFQPLELGGEGSGRVLVRAGLEGGELLVSSPPPSLEDGDRVRLEE